MNKCEHGQKISMFCASDCCVWKEAGGCDSCMKKYHNHMGPTIFLNEQQIISLVKKYAMDSNIKPKCRILQQAIFSYFTLIKTELTNSMDIICKNIINQIGYPYLYSNNTLSTYKRLKNKQYKKLIQKQFKVLYQLSQKINEKQLAKEQAKIYMNQMKNTEQLLNNLEDLLKRYETIAKTSQPAFVHDTSYMIKINQVIHALRLDSQSPSRSNKHKEPKQTVDHQKNSIQINNFVKQKQQSNKLQLSKRLAQTTTFHSRQVNIGAPPTLPRQKHRQVSIDKKILKQHKFGSGKQPKQKVQRQQGDLAWKQHQNKVQQITHQLNAKQLQLNQKKKFLIDMMKQKQENNKNQKQKAKEESSEIQKTESEFSKYRGFAQKIRLNNRQLSSNGESTLSKDTDSKASSKLQQKDSYNFQTFGFTRTITTQSHQTQSYANQDEQQDKKQDQQQAHQAFTNLPIVEKLTSLSQDVREVTKKMIILPKPEHLNEIQNNQSMLGQSQSPILKRINLQTQNKLKQSMINMKQQSKQLKPDPEVFKKINFTFSKQNEILQLKDNEQKSLALLLKSLTLNASDAINYLEKSLQHADNNLSAAQYLTYLYLELNQPQNCLYLCNKMLQKIQNSSDPEQLSLIINNNKAAALNILGRYSESIVILQKCLKCREKDYFYKNLGDAYFSISIYQKAVYNYQKALKMNECFDEAQYNLAVCLFVQQNYFNAKLSIKKALQQQPLNEDYLQLLHNIEIRINHC